MSRWKMSLVIAVAMACPIVVTATPLAPTAAADVNCYAYPLQPNGAASACSDTHYQWMKVRILCQGIRGAYTRFGPRIYAGAGARSVIYCDQTSDARLSYGWDPG
jgi:hypothetical protein